MPDPGNPGATLADVSEEQLLALIFPLVAPLGPAAEAASSADPAGFGPMVLGPGDDAAVLATASGSVVATTDTMVRDRDWRDAWSTGADVGHKVVAQNLADVAAMGAVPTGLLLTLVADPATPVAWVLDLARGIGEAARGAEVVVLGGDLSSAPGGTLMVSVTALGDLQGRDPVRRSGACPGDLVALAGSLGLAGAGWRLLEAGSVVESGGASPMGAPPPDTVATRAVARQRRPQPPLPAGPQASDAGATSMLDLSDGLLRDAGRVARASGVVLALDEAALAADIALLTPVLGQDLARECVLGGGEEHSLLATFPPGTRLPSGWRVLGRVEALGASGAAGVTVGGRVEAPLGWDHFAG
ncbi:thiamine-phosphate kinase [Dermatophilaceae bacterium Soc4.6]